MYTSNIDESLSVTQIIPSNQYVISRRLIIAIHSKEVDETGVKMQVP
jgi:hypothetical protein